MANICHVWSVQLFLASEYKETCFYCEGGQTLEQVAQVGYGVPHLSVHGPGQPAVNDPA